MADATDLPKTTTIVDIARAAGVSISTASRAINGRPGVSKRAREAVAAAIDTFSYTVNPAARSLVGARTRLLGLQARNLAVEFSSEIIRGVFEVSEHAGYGVLLFASDAGPGSPTAPLLRTLPDGYLIVVPGLEAESDQPIAIPTHPNRPTVLVEAGQADSSVATVTVTNRAGTMELVRYLIGLGHRRIGFITGRMSVPASRQRLDGYYAALAEAGIAAADELVYFGRFAEDDGVTATRRFLGLATRPSAIVASNDVEAFGVYRAAQEAGLRVPDDLSVAGFDDIMMARLVYPPLTTVHQPLERMGRRAAEMLIAWIEGTPPDPAQVVLPTELIIRGSCTPPSEALGVRR